MDQQQGSEPSTEQIDEKVPARGIGYVIWDVLKIFIISFAIILPIRYYVAQPFIVSGESMQPNFQNAQYLIIDELGARSQQRGDVIVFHYPRDTKQYFIKRVIGLPGERVSINSGKITIYNAQNPSGTVLDESAYLPAGTQTQVDVDETLASDEYFVLGDNRAASFDSRFWGPVPTSDIVGRVVLRAFPFQTFTGFSHVTYK